MMKMCIILKLIISQPAKYNTKQNVNDDDYIFVCCIIVCYIVVDCIIVNDDDGGGGGVVYYVAVVDCVVFDHIVGIVDDDETPSNAAKHALYNIYVDQTTK